MSLLLDERILELLDRKYALVASAPDQRFLLDALRLLEWLFAEDLVRPYALQVLSEDQPERIRFAEHRKNAHAELLLLHARLQLLYPDARTEPTVPETSPAFASSMDRFAGLLMSEKDERTEEADLEREPAKDSTVLKLLLSTLQGREEKYRGKDASDETESLGQAVHALVTLHDFRFREVSLRLQTSPGRSLRKLLEYLRALNPPPENTNDWMSFVPQNGWKSLILGLDLRERKRHEALVPELRVDLERVHEAIHAALGTSLSSLSLVSRFKERCTWFDKWRMRSIAAGNGEEKGVREDRLTMELARYLHDNGLFSLVRVRMANLEPDVISPFGARRLVIESKVYDKGESARGAVRHGFWQLHSYLTALETKTVHAHEGFLVIFRLGGGICDAPSTASLNRFRIHILTIDLGEDGSGHAQPKPSHVTLQDLIDVAAGSSPPLEEALHAEEP